MNRNVKSKRVISFLLSLIMILSCFSVSFGVIASAAEWEYVNGVTYDPVTLYVQADTMTAGKVYLIAIRKPEVLINGVNTTVTTNEVTRKAAGETAYYTTDDGSDVKYVAKNYYLADESSVATTYVNNEFKWTSGSKIYHPATKKYLVNDGTGAVKMSTSSVTWTYSNNVFSRTVSSQTRYIRMNSSNAIVLGTKNSNNTVYPYEKITLYKKSASGEGGLYKYVGETAFAADFEGTFDESVILNSIAVLHKQPGADIPDEECAKLKIDDAAVTFAWNQPVNINKLGTYTGTVYVNGSPLQEITVSVQEHAQAHNGMSDPSTSRVEDQFSLTSADDGKMASDKTVQYCSDEFDAFENYAKDEFSVALSALGQSYKAVDTEETEEPVKIHPDVVFVLDASGSMRQYTVTGEKGETTTISRAEATAEALNAAIKELYANDPETRIGIVTFGFDYLPGAVLLPLDKYTLPDGQTDYILWGGRNNAVSSNSGTASGTYQKRVESASKNVTDIPTRSKWHVNLGNRTDPLNLPAYSSMKKIATVNGVTYYADESYSDICIWRSDAEFPVAYMTPNKSNDEYSPYYYDSNINIKVTGSNSISYTTNSYQTVSGKVNFEFQSCHYMISTNYLINSKNETVKPTFYQYNAGTGTYTQAGLQAGENLFKAVSDVKERVPAIVLVSDGVPTVADSNVNNPSLVKKNGVTLGHGVTYSIVTSQDLCDFGLYTIETAMKVKENVNALYAESGNREALFYTIGPGVDYTFGQAILNPTNENLDIAAADATDGMDDDDSEYGVGVPRDLAATIRSKYNDLTYVDYADWSFTGDMSSNELVNAFKKIVTSILDTTRPVSTTTYSEGETAAMVFTDVIGEGMSLCSEPVVRYANNNYAPTGKSTETLEDGTVITSYTYDYRVNEESTHAAYNLKGLNIQIINSADGKETVKWSVPAELIPIIVYDGFDEVYVPVSPIRLIYKVGLDDDVEMNPGTYYTNSTAEPANSQFTPAVGNPYYYDNKKGSDKKMHSTLKSDQNETIRKTTNTTGTKTYSHDMTVDENGMVTTGLGNNGLIEILLTTLALTKVWDDGNNVTGQRPDSITVQIYRNGAIYGEPRTVYAKDCDILQDENGNDIWIVYFRGLPYNESFEYTIGEYSIPDHDTYISNRGDDITITNRLKRGEIEYELYLVDNRGTPIDMSGNEVAFEDRTTMSELVEVNAYIHTTTVIDLDELEALLPEGYFIYNPETSYTEKFEGVDSPLNEASVADITDNRTTVISIPDTAEIDDDGNVSGLGGYEKVKISFAIAKIEILPDVIVVDYGKTILCSPLDNDTGAIRLLGLGAMDGDTYSDTYTSQNGVFRVEGDNVTFSPFSYMSSINRVRYYAEVVKTTKETQILDSTIFVIPATTVYYEDDFGGEAENGGVYIQYTGDWYTIDDEGKKVEGVTANTDTDDRQDRGEVGQGHTPYGYDSSYDYSTQFCNGTSAVAEGKTVIVNGKPQSNATAGFTFTGTGFDIISRTDLDCGMITVVINDHETGKFYSSVPVINKGVNDLYQIPVVSFEGMPYGTYDVIITVNAPSAFLGINGSVFYLDAIRIYNPMGLESSDNEEFDEANDAYNADNEANAFTELIRNCLISADNLDVTDSYGAVYVDTLDNDYEKTGSGMIGNIKSPEFTSEEIRTRMIDLEKTQNMELIGPNEEVYLSRGYGVGFIAESSVIPKSVQLEIKIPEPTGTLMLAVQTYGDSSTVKYVSLSSATEMYYDITDAVKFVKVGDMYRATVIISNIAPMTKSAGLEGIISITNLKMTYGDEQIVNPNSNGFLLSGTDKNAVQASLVANRAVYTETYDTVYVQTAASTPNYDVVNAEANDEVSVGETAVLQFNTANCVENVTVTAPDGKEVRLDSLTCTVDESKILSDDFLNAKTWTATFTPDEEGEFDYTIEAADGDGESASVNLSVMPSKIVSLKVVSSPAKTNYKYGDSIDISGLVLEAKYNDGSVKQIRSGYTLSTYKADHLGQKTVTVSYEGMTAGFRIKTSFSLTGLIKSIFSR